MIEKLKYIHTLTNSPTKISLYLETIETYFETVTHYTENEKFLRDRLLEISDTFLEAYDPTRIDEWCALIEFYINNYEEELYDTRRNYRSY